MSFDLVLKPCCNGCGSSKDLYGSNCKHLTLCFTCGKTMAEKYGKCYECGATISRLIREYKVRACSSSDKTFFIGRFATGLPIISRKQNAQNKWSLQKEGFVGRQLTEALREKYKNKPWLLENEMGQSQYRGYLEGAQSASYYQLMMQGKEFVAIPSGSWYNFNKVAQYKQLSLEEAEEKMKNRRKTADGYQRWMMKAANNGPAAFGEAKNFDDEEGGASGRRGHKKTGGDVAEANASDKGEEDEEEEEAAGHTILGLYRRGSNDDEETPRGGDLDLDDEDIEKGDDWEHEDTFTDDDEAVGNDHDEQQEFNPEIPVPPEIKQDEEDDDETNEEEGGLSKSGKELTKLLKRVCGSNVKVAEDGDDDIDDGNSPVLASKQKHAPKEEPYNNIQGTPTTSNSAKGKRKLNGEDAKASDGAPPKKVKTENEVKSPKGKPSSSAKPSSTTSTAGPVTEDEIRAVLMQNPPVTAKDLVNVYFKSRLQCKEDKDAFKAIFKRICRFQKTEGASYVVLREKGIADKGV